MATYTIVTNHPHPNRYWMEMFWTQPGQSGEWGEEKNAYKFDEEQSAIRVAEQMKTERGREVFVYRNYSCHDEKLIWRSAQRRQGMKVTKLDMARQIVCALYSLPALPAVDDRRVIRWQRQKKYELELRLPDAIKVIQRNQAKLDA